MTRPKSNNVQINISIPLEWKIELENLARIYSVEEGETITFLDLMKMTKLVKVTVDIDIARRMLRLAHNKSVSHLTDDEVFEEVINMNSAYGAKSFIESD